MVIQDFNKNIEIVDLKKENYTILRLDPNQMLSTTIQIGSCDDTKLILAFQNLQEV